MDLLILLIIGTGVICLAGGAILGYSARQSIAKRQIGTLEEKIQSRLSQAKQSANLIIQRAKQKADQEFEKIRKEENRTRGEFSKTRQLLLSRENAIEERFATLKKREGKFRSKIKKLKEIKANIEDLKNEALSELERVSQLSRDEAREELLQGVEKVYSKDILERIRRLKEGGRERYKRLANEVVASAVQKYATSQARELTATDVLLPDDELKGRIIGRQGRNIRTLERLTGVEIVVDDTPGIITISGFNPIRRQVARIALEELIEDGRIQPARIERVVDKAESEVSSQIKEAGAAAVREVGCERLDPKLIQLLGRLRFRTSYGQNVLMHSIEVAHLAGALATELGQDVDVSKKAGLLHDIGKAIDGQVEGSHVDIGIKILKKFDVEQRIIDAMKSHHDEYPAQSVEAILVQTADAISGSRPGARKDTLEDYLERVKELEDVALSFEGVQKAWALEAGREIRVFVSPKQVDDLSSEKLARQIADRVQEELKYPGEIKVVLIREHRIIEYAK